MKFFCFRRIISPQLPQLYANICLNETRHSFWTWIWISSVPRILLKRCTVASIFTTNSHPFTLSIDLIQQILRWVQQQTSNCINRVAEREYIIINTLVFASIRVLGRDKTNLKNQELMKIFGIIFFLSMSFSSVRR